MGGTSDGRYTLHAANPGVGTSLEIAYATGEREEIDLVEVAGAVLAEHDHPVVRDGDALLHEASGFVLLPSLVNVEADDDRVRTTTTIQLHHPALPAEGVFEYQHSAGDTVRDALASGVTRWIGTDLVTLLDAVRAQPTSCASLEMTFPALADAPARVRRAILGPVAHVVTGERPEPEGGEEHPFCPCCLLTNAFEAFQPLFSADGFYALRLFAARDADGTPQADCRVNGEDWEPGAEALRAYVRTWPGAGFEFRKQYVVIRGAPTDA